MKERILRYLNGEFDYESGSLVFSCSKIEWNLKEGESLQGVFSIEGENGKAVIGSVYSSHLRMKCLTETFAGSKNEIAYEFDGAGMGAGEVIKGNFEIISDVGEAALPFVINIRREMLETSLGSIRNLFHFTNLAKSNWNEAVKVFYSPLFWRVFSENDRKYKNLYKGLRNGCDKNLNLEEFLVGINKKQPIEFLADSNEILMEDVEGMTAREIVIQRNGWGYTGIRVSADADFITVEKEYILEDDFLGSSCRYVFYVNSERLHAGKNYGRIVFHYATGVFSVTVTAVRAGQRKKNHMAHRQKSLVYAITRHYLDFRMKKITMSKWLLLTQELIDHSTKTESGDTEHVLFKAHLLITQERFQEAKWLLDHSIADPKRLSDTLYCYYLYLTSLYNVDEYYTKEVAEYVKNIYQQHSDNWRIAWIMIYISAEYNKNPALKWEFLKKQLSAGCISPILYLEIIMLLNSAPVLLRRLDREEKRALLFGAKNQILSPDLMRQITYLSRREKGYDKELLSLLEEIYQKDPQDDTLLSVCLLLMKGGKIGEEYFPWYERAVIRDLQITRLYEYYMMSRDLYMDGDIPRRVLMYFSFQSELTSLQNASLYAYVVKNRSKSEELYMAFEPQISRFVLKQMYDGKIDKNLAYLYQEIILKKMKTPDNLRQLATLFLIHCIHVKDKDIVNVVLANERQKQEIVYPISAKKAYIPLFGSDYILLLEDEGGNRYYGSREYSIECFFLPRKILPFVEQYAQDCVSFNLFLCGGNGLTVVSSHNEKRYRYLESLDELEDDFRCRIRMDLLRFYFQEDHGAALDEMLSSIKPEDVLLRDRPELVRIMSIRAFYRKAYDFVIEYGTELIEPKTLVRICSRLLEEEGDYESRDMTLVIHRAFERGKYNETALNYLMRYYRGSLKNLRDIWKAASNFELDTYYICERIMVQMLETGAFVGEEKEIFRQYVMGGAKREIEMAYISYCSFEYLVHERLTDEFVFRDMERIFQTEKKLSTVCMLAFLKFYAPSIKTVGETTQKVCRDFIHILYVGRHVVMPFFLEFREISTDASMLCNRTLIEYKGNPDSTVVIHYRISQGEDESQGYCREEMQNMYGGIFVKEFLMFFGENLQYYITEEYANKEQLTESGAVTKSDSPTDGLQDRYRMINDIAVANVLKDYSAAARLLEEYECKKYMTDMLFFIQ